MENFADAVQRLWFEKKRLGGDRRRRLAFLLRWAGLHVAHKKEYQKRRRATRRSWKKFMGMSCWVCHVAKATCRHHVIQVQHGGGNDDRNIVPLCEGCHAEVHPWMDASEHPIVIEAREMDAKW
jgi:5-methylcytosine-specific restriction endonuclease McrA